MVSYLTLKGFEVKSAEDLVDGYRTANEILPDLIICNRKFTNYSAEGFLIKKRTMAKIKSTPVFLMGDFKPEEIMKFKKENVYAFLSLPLNPQALAERLYLFFNMPIPQELGTWTPMLFDLNMRGSIITIQIEGNLELDKLEIMNYLLRCFCREKRIKRPKILVFIPNLYPESITMVNVDALMKFRKFPELEIDSRNIKILTSIDKLVTYIHRLKGCFNFEAARDFLDAMHALQIDFSKEKTVPVDFLKAGCFYIFDLFDAEGRRMIPAMTRVSEDHLSRIKDSGIKTLSYFGDTDYKNIEEIYSDEQHDLVKKRLMDTITADYEAISTEIHSIQVLNEKQSLFFRKLKGQNLLIITQTDAYFELIKGTLDIYFQIDRVPTGENIEEVIEKTKYICIFIDTNISPSRPLDILTRIRTLATRRKTSVIILTPMIDKISVMRFKNCGTDNIILEPFSSATIQKKLFDALTLDRKS